MTRSFKYDGESDHVDPAAIDDRAIPLRPASDICRPE